MGEEVAEEKSMVAVLLERNHREAKITLVVCLLSNK